MKDIFFRPEAEVDLEDIWDYTYEMWGRGQANQYVGQIRTFIESVAAGRRQLTSVARIRQGYKRGLVGRHAVFFRVDEQTVTVVRILHQRMDVQRL